MPETALNVYGLDVIEASVADVNAPSLRVLRKAGYYLAGRSEDMGVGRLSERVMLTVQVCGPAVTASGRMAWSGSGESGARHPRSHAETGARSLSSAIMPNLGGEQSLTMSEQSSKHMPDDAEESKRRTEVDV